MTQADYFLLLCGSFTLSGLICASNRNQPWFSQAQRFDRKTIRVHSISKRLKNQVWKVGTERAQEDPRARTMAKWLQQEPLEAGTPSNDAGQGCFQTRIYQLSSVVPLREQSDLSHMTDHGLTTGREKEDLIPLGPVFGNKHYLSEFPSWHSG